MIAGLRILVVEDDPFIQMELEAVLVDHGAVVLGPCSSSDDALSIASSMPVDVAVLDFGLNDGTSAPVARYLEATGTPFLFYTGQLKTDARLAEWAARPLLPKPSHPAKIVSSLAELGRSRESASCG